jgi:UDP-glucose 4-epimerase
MILVTGGCGFIGMHTVRALLDAGQDVVAGYHSTRREPVIWSDAIGSRLHIEEVDVANAHQLNAVVGKHNVDGIIHLAMPGYGKLTAAQDFATNMPGLLNVLEAAREHRMKRVTMMSSSAVYGGLPEGPFVEGASLPMQSTSATEAYKKAWEILGFHFAERAGIDVAAARVPGIYGPLYYSMVNLPSRLCHAAARGTEPNFEGAIGGVPKEDAEMDFLFVKDCARGLSLLQLADNPAHRVYNFGVGHATKLGELRDAILDAEPNAKIRLNSGGGAAQSPQRYLDISRAKADLGFQPAYDINRGVAEYLHWLASHPQ